MAQRVLTLTDAGGNGDACSLLVPEGMDRWRLGAFLDFLAAGAAAPRQGYLARAPEPQRFESFRQMMLFPESTYNPPIVFVQAGRALGQDDFIDLSGGLNEVALERDDPDTRPDCGAISVSARNRRAMETGGGEIIAAIDELFDFQAHPIVLTDGRRAESVGELVDDFADALDTDNKTRLLFRIAQRIHAAPFENTSKILAGRQFRPGHEMWPNMQQGFGGVCGEKTAALQFFCDMLSIPTRPVLGSDSVIGPDFSESLRQYLDSYGEHKLSADIHHHMLEVRIDGRWHLLDPTGGNIPLAFLDNTDAETLIRHGYRARMVYRVDRLNLRRASTWTGDALLTLSEYHIPRLHLQYVFEQGLGLHISADTYLGVYFDWGGQSSELRQNYYASRARKVRFPYPRFIHENNLHSVPDPLLRDLLAKTLAALRHQYDNQEYTGGFTFVVQPLTPHFWTMPRVSDSVKGRLWR